MVTSFPSFIIYVFQNLCILVVMLAVTSIIILCFLNRLLKMERREFRRQLLSISPCFRLGVTVFIDPKIEAFASPI